MPRFDSCEKPASLQIDPEKHLAPKLFIATYMELPADDAQVSGQFFCI